MAHRRGLVKFLAVRVAAAGSDNAARRYWTTAHRIFGC
jgi:hypothetical protein